MQCKYIHESHQFGKNKTKKDKKTKNKTKLWISDGKFIFM